MQSDDQMATTYMVAGYQRLYVAQPFHEWGCPETVGSDIGSSYELWSKLLNGGLYTGLSFTGLIKVDTRSLD